MVLIEKNSPHTQWGILYNPIKMHILAGMSKSGATHVTIFIRIMDAEHLVRALKVGLPPFKRDCYPDSHHLQQDNDPNMLVITLKSFSKSTMLISDLPYQSPN